MKVLTRWAAAVVLVLVAAGCGGSTDYSAEDLVQAAIDSGVECVGTWQPASPDDDPVVGLAGAKEVWRCGSFCTSTQTENGCAGEEYAIAATFPNEGLMNAILGNNTEPAIVGPDWFISGRDVEKLDGKLDGGEYIQP